MNRLTEILQSKWTAAAVAMLSFLGTTAFALSKALPELAKPAAAVDPLLASRHATGPSWDFNSPELTQLVDELRQERLRLAEKDRNLQKFEIRLQSEQTELAQVRQTIEKMRADFDAQIVQVKDEEVANLKKLAKVFAAMKPASAVTILKDLDEDALVRILTFMRERETAPILSALAAVGDKEAALAASLTERMRLLVYRNASSNP